MENFFTFYLQSCFQSFLDISYVVLYQSILHLKPNITKHKV